MEPSSKRRRVDSEGPTNLDEDGVGRSVPASLSHPISPPRKRHRESKAASSSTAEPSDASSRLLFKSPFQLTWIRDLPQEANRETVTLKDVLGDPLIAECWEFNYLHDIDFLMAAFDDDVRHLVKVHVVHGFWKREDPSRLRLQVGPALVRGRARLVMGSAESSTGASRAARERGAPRRLHAGDVWHPPLQDDDPAAPRRVGPGHHSHGEHDPPGLDEHDPRALAVTPATPSQRPPARCQTRPGGWEWRKVQGRFDQLFAGVRREEDRLQTAGRSARDVRLFSSPRHAYRERSRPTQVPGRLDDTVGLGGGQEGPPFCPRARGQVGSGGADLVHRHSGPERQLAPTDAVQQSRRGRTGNTAHPEIQGCVPDARRDSAVAGRLRLRRLYSHQDTVAAAAKAAPVPDALVSPLGQ